MDFKKAAVISNFLSKDYAEGLFKLLLAYQDISASEAASRLNMHIRTVQDFLETMADYDIIEKKEVYEKKRPYNRYSLIKKKIEIIIDLESALGEALGLGANRSTVADKNCSRRSGLRCCSIVLRPLNARETPAFFCSSGTADSVWMSIIWP